MTLEEFEAACEAREKSTDEALTRLEKAVEQLALTMDRVYNNT